MKVRRWDGEKVRKPREVRFLIFPLIRERRSVWGWFEIL